MKFLSLFTFKKLTVVLLCNPLEIWIFCLYLLLIQCWRAGAGAGHKGAA